MGAPEIEGLVAGDRPSAHVTNWIFEKHDGDEDYPFQPLVEVGVRVPAAR